MDPENGTPSTRQSGPINTSQDTWPPDGQQGNDSTNTAQGDVSSADQNAQPNTAQYLEADDPLTTPASKKFIIVVMEQYQRDNSFIEI